ncbi:hypothetical protein RJ640_026831 [Escallonia rubra]|uniref:Uncharacterized protein n=1 Tax=Escallonia rubra TaxID=112253 RepID=A0AA88RR05_9ASTE|nr:hypothetical protein RJ640_026831 [Escallonia rubra]
MNSLLNSPGKGYLYNYQTKEFYNLTYAHEQPEGSATFGDYFATKCGVLMMSLFVFFTTTMSVSFTLRETQTRMLKFTVQLQHHARHRLPTFQLIFVHVIESLVFVPVPALQRFMQNRRSHFHQNPDFHITSSTILASTLHIRRLNRRNAAPANIDMTPGPGPRAEHDLAMPTNGEAEFSGLHEEAETDNLDRLGPLGNPSNVAEQPDIRQPDNNAANPGAMNSFSSLLLWILGGASSEGLNSFFSMFREARDQGQAYAGTPRRENRAAQSAQ